MSIARLVKNYKELKKEIAEQMSTTFEFDIREILKDDEKKYIYKGYTPSFNDGDPCTFSFYEDEYKEGEFGWSSQDNPRLFEYMDSIPDEFFADHFGEYGFRIILSKDGVSVKDYEHGY